MLNEQEVGSSTTAGNASEADAGGNERAHMSYMTWPWQAELDDFKFGV